MGKTILLINRNINVSLPMQDHLQKMGFDVYVLFESYPPGFKYPTIFHKLNNIFRIYFFKDNNYIKLLKEKHNLKYVQNCINKIAKKTKGLKFDYALLIRADKCPEEVVKFAREKSQECIAYQYDGLSTSMKIFQYIKYFDQVCVFDPQDEKNYPEFKFLTNFYYKEEYNIEKPIYDFYYVGLNVDNRKEILSSLFRGLKEKNQEYKFLFMLVTGQKGFYDEKEGIEYKEQSTNFIENLKFTKESNVLIDIQRPVHEGLSFRFFEALFYGKKIITNNSSIINYDFYNPNNILVTDFRDISKIENFLSLPYEKIDPIIIEKYSFNNWISNILNIGNHIPISSKTSLKN